ncbi:hypothetical protein V8F20_009876 [Naviculisporaceae sp. PSN 640]
MFGEMRLLAGREKIRAYGVRRLSVLSRWDMAITPSVVGVREYMLYEVLAPLLPSDGLILWDLLVPSISKVRQARGTIEGAVRMAGTEEILFILGGNNNDIGTEGSGVPPDWIRFKDDDVRGTGTGVAPRRVGKSLQEQDTFLIGADFRVLVFTVLVLSSQAVMPSRSIEPRHKRPALRRRSMQDPDLQMTVGSVVGKFQIRRDFRAEACKGEGAVGCYAPASTSLPGPREDLARWGGNQLRDKPRASQ